MARPSATDDGRSFTMRVYKHHMREARKGSVVVSLKNPEKRTCTETGISRSTLRRWNLENGNSDAADKGQPTYGQKQVLALIQIIFSAVYGSCLNPKATSQ